MSENKLFSINVVRQLSGSFCTQKVVTPIFGHYQAVAAARQLQKSCHTIVSQVSGRYQGDTGLIVRIQENLIVLFSDVTMHELKVLPRDLQRCSDIAPGVDFKHTRSGC